MADTNTPPAGTNTQGSDASKGVDQSKIDALTAKPTVGDFVKVGDKAYSPKDIQAILDAQEMTKKEVQAAKDLTEKQKEVIRKVYADPENPDRTALREVLMMAGKSKDEADQLIEDELGPAEGDEPKERRSSKKKETPEPKQLEWGTKAWLRNEYKTASTTAFSANQDLQKFVEAARTREGGGKDGDEAAEFVKSEILGNLSKRADTILRERIRKEGQASFEEDPVNWFQSAMKQAAADEAGIARKRYGDPNKVGRTPGGTVPDPNAEWLEANKKPTQQRYDPAKTQEERRKDFASSFAHAVLSGLNTRKQ